MWWWGKKGENIDKDVRRNVQVEMPFGYDNLEHAVHYTNFDSTGRYVVVIQKHNVVREHQQPIQVRYSKIKIKHGFRGWYFYARIRSLTTILHLVSCKSHW